MSVTNRVGEVLKKTYSCAVYWNKKKQLMEEIQRVADEPSYYSEKTRKSKEVRLKDLRVWLKEYGEVNHCYNVYGLDIVGSDPSPWLDYYCTYYPNRNELNHVNELYSMASILEDKFLFFRTMRGAQIPTPNVFAFLFHGQLLNSDLNGISFESLIEKKDYFLKDAYGICGNFVKHILDYSHLMTVVEGLPDGGYIFQDKIEQCEEEKTLYPGSVNTLRIVTIKPQNEKPYLYAKLQRIGCKETGNVDNWAAGGIAVGIQDNGYLKEYGIRKYQFGGKTNVHPDSGVVFSGFKVPMLDEAIELALRAHTIVYNLHSVGWDVALTSSGPILLEGNENWDMSLAQACDRPLRHDWEKAIM